ncbi:MAG: AraC family transcriptional regulator [Gracilimonas sp.]|uniref:helix-turn-helix domain-containing protein n=1 Tax=Gracilimonas sp. TaxID=1974203 RepID=UPI0019CDF996|nr:helix-turn-helix domain-containing protein [Gracilimonas sp.]MBD3615528.1 AraC family transcriptional regulator [Gracilimonas sp.]
MKQPMENALQIARENIKEIRTVTEWAEEMNYNSSKYFSRRFRNHYQARPKLKLIEFRLEKFCELIKEKSEISCYEIAFELGLKDDIALNKFIKRHTGKPPREWKNG